MFCIPQAPLCIGHVLQLYSLAQWIKNNFLYLNSCCFFGSGPQDNLLNKVEEPIDLQLSYTYCTFISAAPLLKTWELWFRMNWCSLTAALRTPACSDSWCRWIDRRERLFYRFRFSYETHAAVCIIKHLKYDNLHFNLQGCLTYAALHISMDLQGGVWVQSSSDIIVNGYSLKWIPSVVRK